MNRPKNAFIVIAGCSRLGSGLAGNLCEKGIDVTVIDRDMQAFRRLPSHYSGFQLLGDATDTDILENAGIYRATLLVAATENDNVNCMIAQIACQIYHVRQVFARFDDPDLSYLLQESEAHILCSAELAATAFANSCILTGPHSRREFFQEGERKCE